MTKTTIQWLKEYLETKILPCPEGNDYVYGMNVAHTCLIEYMIPYLLEKEKEQIIDAYENGVGDENERNLSGNFTNAEQYYNQTYNQNKRR
jgi:hypothetical protein